jgi:hypothetical protein
MTAKSSNRLTPLTKSEWQEAKDLLKAVNYAPSTVCPTRMERLSDYIVRSLIEKNL